MLSFNNFIRLSKETDEISEANLGSHPDNYPPGALVRLNKNLSIGPYEEGEIFSILFISSKQDEKIEDIYIIGTKISNPIWIGLTDSSGKSFQIKISKSSADNYFLKGTRSRGGEKTSVIFANKELTPDSLGFSGKSLNIDEILTELENNKKLKQDEKDFLISLLEAVNSNGNSFDIDVPNKFLTELATISKDFGEIISAVWLLNNSESTEIIFPEISNLPFIDLYGVDGKTLIPYSVKSEGGSKVSIGNILNSIDDVIKNPEKATGVDLSFNEEELFAIDIMKKIISLPMKDGMIEGHRILDTPAINELSNVIGVSKENITSSIIDKWLNNKTSQELKDKLSAFYTKAASRPTDKMFETDRDKNRLIVGPLGESLKREMNNRSFLLNTLNRLANLVEATQVNISIKPKTITLNQTKFVDAKFKFGWAGYSGGNKLGFTKVG